MTRGFAAVFASPPPSSSRLFPEVIDNRGHEQHEAHAAQEDGHLDHQNDHKPVFKLNPLLGQALVDVIDDAGGLVLRKAGVFEFLAGFDGGHGGSHKMPSTRWVANCAASIRAKRSAGV